MATREASYPPHTRTEVHKNKWVYPTAIAVAFVLGLVPGWYMAHQSGEQASQTRDALRYYRVIDSASAAELFAARGQYEEARQRASKLFSDLRSEFDTPDRLNSGERDKVTQILQQRDDVITLLARGDAAARDRLLSIEYELRQTFSEQLKD